MKAIAVILILSLVAAGIPFPAAGAENAPPPQAATEAAGRAETRVYRVSPDEFRRMEPLLRQWQNQHRAEIIQIAQLPTDSTGTPPAAPVSGVSTNPAVTNAAGTVTNAVSGPPSAPRPTPPAVAAPAPAGDTMPPKPPLVASAADAVTHGEHDHGFVDLMWDLSHADWGDKDGAIVIFVIIGVAVVLTVVVYAAAFLYDAVTGAGETRRWWDMEGTASFLTSSGNSGFMGGARLSAGLERNDAKVGLVIDGGYLNARIRTQDSAQTFDVSGGYAMAGAGVRWRLDSRVDNPSCFGLELLAGTASDEQVDLMSEARATLTFGLGSRMRLGVSLGALYLGLKAKDGLLGDVNDFSTLLGLHSGIRF